METFEVVEDDGKNYSFVVMKNGVRIDYENCQEYICYSNVKNIHCYKSGQIVIRANGEDMPYTFQMDKVTSQKIMPVLTKCMQNYYNETDKTQQIMDELAEIKKQLANLFYAPPIDNFVPPGYQEAKTDFEEKTKN